MKVTALNCPSCGGNLDVKPWESVVKCPFCGTSVNIDRSAERAEMAKQMAGVQEAQGKAVKSFAKLYLIFFFIVFIVIVIGMILTMSTFFKSFSNTTSIMNERAAEYKTVISSQAQR